ncbi:MAG: amidase [Cytophagales bacterium]|nr:amidase [Cytophagales bacterium]
MRSMLMVLVISLAIGCVSDTPNSYLAHQYLQEISITQLRQGYEQGSYTIEQVVKDYLQRIEDLDKKGPALNSIIYVNPHALELARELDSEWKAGKIRGPLHGIPVIVKDNLNTADMPTTAGATVLHDSYPPDDSHLVKKLKTAGAIIIAKANLSEWANFRASKSSSGWSGMLGQTKNPYVLDRNPCGSSSGSGVAASASLCAIAIGTETNGSIVCPSNANGLVGLKPTVGLLSRSGIIPISFTQDTAGPMGRSVTDVAITLGVLAGVDARDEKTLAAQGNYLTDYTSHLKADGLKGKRIGWLKSIGGYHARVDTLMKRALADLRAQGAEVVELDFTMERSAGSASFTVLLYEFKDGLTNYFASLGPTARVKDLKELMEFNKSDSVELNHFDQNLVRLASEKGTLLDKEYTDALATMLKATRENGIDKLLKENNLHALVAPTGAPAWKTDWIDGDHFLGGSSSLAAIAGYPSITVPMGFVDVLPVGISFFSTAWQEPVLIEIAYSYEQATRHRQAPKFIASR